MRFGSSTIKMCVVAVVVCCAAGSAVAQPALYLIEPAQSNSLLYEFAQARNAPVVVGYSTVTDSAGDSLSYRWTPLAGRQDLPGIFPPGSRSRFYGVSDNGQVGAGYSALITPGVFHWSASSGYSNIGTPAGRTPYDNNQLNSMWTSNDGSSVVGTFLGTNSNRAPYRWTQASGWQLLFQPRLVTQVYDVSADGNTMVGYSQDFNSGAGFVYRQGLGLTETGDFTPRGVSDDGLYLIGDHPIPDSFFYAPRITFGSTVLDLALPAGFSEARGLDISNDGGIAVGRLVPTDIPSATAFVWTPESGMRTISDYLNDFGLAFPMDASVQSVSISGDGTTIAGVYSFFGGRNTFVAVIPAPPILALFSLVGVACASRRRR